MLSPPNPSPPNVHIIGMQGLGDNIYQRAFVKQLTRQAAVTLETAWPELYADLPVGFVNPNTRLRTQAKNARRAQVKWVARPPRPAYTIRNSYVKAFQSKRSVINGMEDSFGLKLNPADFDLPALPPPPLESDKPIAFIRPVTLRREWLNLARNPLPEYIGALIEALRPTHHVAVVADIEPPEESAVEPLPRGHSNFIRGELSVMAMLSLLAISDIIIGGVGFIVPASLALRRDCFVVLGGNGGHAAPQLILDPRLDCSRIAFAMPKDFCPCTNMRHECRKTIPDLMNQFSRFLDARRSWKNSPSDACSGVPSLASAISM
jgi:hypothetical protein